jgi:hypothetical protein
MAITAGLRPAAVRASHQQPAPEKQNVPPFRGGTWKYSRRAVLTVNLSGIGLPERRAFGAAEKSNCNA